MSFLPLLLSVAGGILAVSGLLIVASHRRRGFVAAGTVLVLAGASIISPVRAAHTVRDAVTATRSAVAGLVDDTESDEAAIVATETDAAP